MDEKQLEVQKLLEQLRDVHAPTISWWPPAPGWWLVLLCVLLLCAYLASLLFRHRKRYHWVGLAEAELRNLESDFKTSQISATTAVSRLSILMRRSAMAARGRRAVARATDEQWIKIVADVGNGHGFGRRAAEVLARAPYGASALADEQVLELLQACRAWLAGARLNQGEANV